MVQVQRKEAETKFSELLEKALAGETVQILDDSGRPLAQIIGSSESQERTPGLAKGQFWMSEDFDKPLEEFREYM